MSDPTSFPAFLQAMGVVAVYAIIRDLVPKWFGRNGKGENGNAPMTVRQHDKECEMKLTPMRKELANVHKDLRALMRANGVSPSED